MMNSKKVIPQGRDNCFSDYFGDLYLKQFDFKAHDLVDNKHLKFNAMIRYVDDITLFFDINKNLDISEHYKILSYITQKISNYFLCELDLKINPLKSEMFYFSNQDQVDEYLNKQSKKVSSKNDIVQDKNDIKIMFSEFISTLNIHLKIALDWK